VQSWLKNAVLDVQEYVYLQIATVRAIFSRPYYFRDVVEQFESIGIGSLTVVLLAGFFTGAVLALQTGITLDQFGARPFVGRLVSASMVKELGPVLTGLMLAGRIGSGIAAELGSMVVTDQINALRTLGTDPVRKLVVPRVLATTFMFPLLTVISIALGILGGLLIAVTNLHLDANYYMRSVIETVKYNDLASGIGKTFFFGFAVSLIACYNGLRTSGGADGVGRSTTETVVTGAITVLIMDFFLTKLFLFIF
jgi:phospholipid/cholesterol/gamma-HCH transport system permease protein